jgi:hypothetical protein
VFQNESESAWTFAYFSILGITEAIGWLIGYPLGRYLGRPLWLGFAGALIGAVVPGLVAGQTELLWIALFEALFVAGLGSLIHYLVLVRRKKAA